MEDLNSELYKDKYISRIQPQVLVVLQAIMARQNFIDSYENYKQMEHRGGMGADYKVYSRLTTLFLLLQDSMNRDLPPEEFTPLKKIALHPSKIDEALEAFTRISQYMYDKKITRFDSQRLNNPANLDDEE